MGFASFEVSCQDGTFDIISRGFEELVGYSRTELRSKDKMDKSSHKLGSLNQMSDFNEN